MKKLILSCFLILLLHAKQNTTLTCEQGNKDDCNDSGIAYSMKAEEKILNDYKDACVVRDGESCLRYGVAMYYGKGVKADKETALRAFSLGCKFKNVSACEAITFMIYRGEGGALPDIKLVEAYRKKACDLGAKDACGEDENYYKRFD